MAVKMGEFLGILMNITNKQTNQAYPEDDVRTKFKNQQARMKLCQSGHKTKKDPEVMIGSFFVLL